MSTSGSLEWHISNDSSQRIHHMRNQGLSDFDGGCNKYSEVCFERSRWLGRTFVGRKYRLVRRLILIVVASRSRSSKKSRLDPECCSRASASQTFTFPPRWLAQECPLIVFKNEEILATFSREYDGHMFKDQVSAWFPPLRVDRPQCDGVQATNRRLLLFQKIPTERSRFEEQYCRQGYASSIRTAQVTFRFR